MVLSSGEEIRPRWLTIELHEEIDVAGDQGFVAYHGPE